jgi:hypothetical protein
LKLGKEVYERVMKYKWFKQLNSQALPPPAFTIINRKKHATALIRMFTTERIIVNVLMLSKAFHVFSWWRGFPDHTELIVTHQRISKTISARLIISSGLAVLT